MRKLLAVVGFLFLAMPCWAQSVLQQTANGMAPGTWVQLPAGPSTGFMFPDGQSSILDVTLGWMTETSNRAGWDSAARKLHFLGSSHDASQFFSRYVTYDEASNTWSFVDGVLDPVNGDRPFFQGVEGLISVVHGYDHNAVGIIGGVGHAFFREYNQPTIWTKRGTANYSNAILPPVPVDFTNCCQSLEWFPEANELVFIEGLPGVSGQPQVMTWTPGATVWNRTAISFDVGFTQTRSAYVPGAGILIFGGGDGVPDPTCCYFKLYKLDALGSVAPIAAPPAEVKVVDWGGIMVGDGRGKLLLLNPDGAATVDEYNPATNTWRVLTAPHPLNATNFNCTANPPSNVCLSAVGVPIPAYGVTMFPKADKAQSAVWLYKNF